MSCCTSRGDEEEQGSVGSLLAGFWPTGTSSSSSRQAVSQAQRAPEDATFTTSRSEEVVGRHVAALPGKEHLLAYNVVAQTGSSRRPLAQHVPCNFKQAIPMENENFSGTVCLIYRPVEGLDRGHPYYDHFSTRKRNWEFRLQGKFKTLPRGDLYVGAVLRDFDYNQSVAATSKLAMNTAMSLIKYQYKIHFSWGARCKDAFKPDAELGCAVSDWTVFDQIIVTPSGRPVPLLSEDLDEVSDAHGMSIMRRDLGLAEYSRMCQEVLQGINTEDTYTFRLWGLSQLLDVLGWQLKIGARVSLDHFMKDFPIHICMYDVDTNCGKDAHHLESQKRYFLDLMGWSSKIRISPELPGRYIFQDAPAGLGDDDENDNDDGHLLSTLSNNSFHSCDGGFTPASSDAPRSSWRNWVGKLRR